MERASIATQQSQWKPIDRSPDQISEDRCTTEMDGVAMCWAGVSTSLHFLWPMNAVILHSKRFPDRELANLPRRVFDVAKNGQKSNWPIVQPSQKSKRSKMTIFGYQNPKYLP